MIGYQRLEKRSGGDNMITNNTNRSATINEQHNQNLKTQTYFLTSECINLIDLLKT
jgi:hypothetical protein